MHRLSKYTGKKVIGLLSTFAGQLCAAEGSIKYHVSSICSILNFYYLWSAKRITTGMTGICYSAWAIAPSF